MTARCRMITGTVLLAASLLTACSNSKGPPPAEHPPDARAHVEFLAGRLSKVEPGSPEYRRILATIEKIKSRHLDPQPENPGELIEAFARLKTNSRGERYLPGYRQRALRHVPKAAKGETLHWVERGPGNVSGRVRSLVVDSSDPGGGTWFAATIGGGIWKTTDFGATWQNKTADLLTLSTTSLVQSRSNPDVFYAGTGMGFGRIVDLVGSGIWKSVDHGESWFQLESTANGELLEAVNRIIVDPNDPDVVLVCSNDGFSHLGPRGGERRSAIFKSTDGGMSWRMVFDSEAVFGPVTDNRVQQLIADPGDFNRIYGAVNEVGVIRSSDAGESWEVVANNFALPGDIGNPTMGGLGLAGISVRTELAIAPSRPERIYAAVERPRGVADLYMSINGGDSWRLLPDTGNDPNWFNSFGASGATGAYTAGWFDNTITVHPTNPEVVFVGGVNLYQITINGGSTRTASPVAWWTFNNQGLPFAHADHHDLEVITTTGARFALIDGNDGGIAFSPDGGLSWTQITGMESSQFYGADKMPGQEVYIGGTQDNGTWRSGTRPGANSPWTFVNGGDGFEVAWNASDPGEVIVTSQFGSYRRSTDGGFNFTSIADARAGSSPFISKIANSKIDPELLFTVGFNGVKRSDDFGESWTLTTIPGNWLGYRPFDNVEISVADPQVVWISSRMDVDPATGLRGGIHVSTDAGLSFTEVSQNLPATLTEASGIATHPTETGTAYLLFAAPGDQKIMRTTDFGRTWTDLSGFPGQAKIVFSGRGFPDVPVYSLLVMPFDTDEIWAGTDIGLVVSTDGGQSWGLAQDGFPRVAVFELSIVDGQIIAATQGRGIWTLDHPELANYEPPAATLSPRMAGLSLRPDGNVRVQADLRSAYDATEIFLNGASFNRQGENASPRSDVYEFRPDVEETISVQVVSRVGDREFKSPVKSLSVYPVGELTSFQSDLNSGQARATFIENGLSLSTPGGFSNTAYHTPHPYAASTDYLLTFRDAVVVPCSGATLAFDEIALIEPGAGSGVFGDPAFFDYGGVEGSRDGVNWLPIGGGVDARSDSAWLTTYNSGGSGNGSLYRRRSVDLGEVFDPGERIFLRFRMFADPGVQGWGWAIDNIELFPDNDPPDDSCYFVGREGISGAWFGADRSGEGWLIEVLPDGRAHVYWFTYPPEAGGQSWLIGTGSLSNGSIVLDDASPFLQPVGARFGDAFSASDVVLQDWGTATFNFNDCNSGSMDYAGPAEFGSGQIEFVRLTAPNGLECRTTGSNRVDGKILPAAHPLAGVSGSWINPEEPGHGWIVEVLDDGGVLVVWFVYSPGGEQAWIIGSAGPEAVSEGGFVIEAGLITDGTVFGPGFDPNAVDRIPWGELEFEFDSCGSGTMRYASELPDYGSGEHFIERFSSLFGAPCAL